MVVYDFSFHSLTAAQNGRRVLWENGIFSQLLRAPRSISQLGCGYVLQVSEEDAVRAAAVMHREDVGFRRVFRVDAQQNAQEAWYDVF